LLLIVLKMADRISKLRRSWNMSKIRSKNTKPEKRVRSVLYQMGYRFRLHNKNLPGIPDIILTKYHTVIFVHGCFWHRHEGCKFAYTPKSRLDFWQHKFDKNVQRDKEVVQELVKLGWRVLIIWECQIGDPLQLQDKLIRFMKEKYAAPLSSPLSRRSTLPIISID